MMGVSSLDNNEFVLNFDDITNIVNALDMYATNERFLAIADNRDFNRDIQSTLSYMRDFENSYKRSEAKYVKLSICI